jgi:ribosomal protein S18 acetylase RimI-like enzyme
MTFVLPDAAKRRRALPWFFAASLRYARLAGHAWVNAGEPAGGAIWIRRFDGGGSVTRAIVSGLAAAPVRLGPEAGRRLGDWVAAAREVREAAVTGPIWYLSGIGVAPALQGRGIGTALMRPGLEGAERDGLPCYLETATEANVDWYRRFGFEVTGRGRVPGGPVFWGMIRK